MTASVDERMDQIRKIVCDIIDINEEGLTDTTDLQEEFGIDSLQPIEILAALEDEFEVEIKQDQLPRMATLQGIYDVVAEAAGW